MQITLSNGLTLNGTSQQVVEAARKLGASIGNDGVYYLSSRRGLIRIADMDENHLRNALRKLLYERSTDYATMATMLRVLQAKHR